MKLKYIRRSFFRKPKKTQFKKKIPSGEFIKGGVTSLIGIAFLSKTATALDSL